MILKETVKEKEELAQTYRDVLFNNSINDKITRKKIDIARLKKKNL